MRTLGLTLLLAALVALVAIGCGEDEPKPTITRLYASESCGVVPLRVDFRADASGGKPLAEPTGGNNWLKMFWDFGDDSPVLEGASIAYHEYAEPGLYTVTVTAEDDRGEQASRSVQVQVNADTLQVTSFALIEELPVDEVDACRPVRFGVTAETCGFDPVNDTYGRFVFTWFVGGQTYRVADPVHTFPPTAEGEQLVIVRLEDPGQSTTRRDTLTVTVLPSAGADLSLRADWLLSTPASPTDTLQLAAMPALPARFTYTVRLENAGPADAYNVVVTGTLPLLQRLALYAEGIVSTGSISYEPSPRRWTWRVPLVAAGTEQTADISFVNEVSWIEPTLSFPSSITPYACDPTLDDVTATARLRRP
jgi:PKD repeat protein